MIIFDDYFEGSGRLDGHVSDSGLEWGSFYYVYDKWGNPVWAPPEGEGDPPYEVDNGLINPYYPQESPLRVLNAWAGSEYIDPWTPWSTGTGDFTLTCVVEFRSTESELSDDVFRVGVFGGDDGYKTLIEYNPYWEEAAVSLDLGDHDPQFVPVGHLLNYAGTNTFSMRFSLRSWGEDTPHLPFQLLINGTVVQSFEVAPSYPGRPHIELSSASPIKIKRLYIENGQPPPPAFWTDIVRAEEVP